MKILFKECASSLIDLKLSAPFDLSFNLFLIILLFVFQSKRTHSKHQSVALCSVTWNTYPIFYLIP